MKTESYKNISNSYSKVVNNSSFKTAQQTFSFPTRDKVRHKYYNV